LTELLVQLLKERDQREAELRHRLVSIRCRSTISSSSSSSVIIIIFIVIIIINYRMTSHDNDSHRADSDGHSNDRLSETLIGGKDATVRSMNGDWPS